LEQEIAEREAQAKANRAAIKQCLEAAGMDRFATACGAEAVLIPRQVPSWDAEKLEKVLSLDEYQQLCPRTPVGRKLAALLESQAGTDVGKELRKCARWQERVALELRTPAEAAGTAAAETGEDHAA
jgi:hypothetical protein